MEKGWSRRNPNRPYNRLTNGKGPAATEMLADVDAELFDFAPVLQMSVAAKSLVDG